MAKHPSFGSLLYWDPAGGSSWKAIGQVTDISGPSVSRGDVDVTDHDNAVDAGGDGWREYTKGVPDAGELTFGVNWDPINKNAHGQVAGTGILSDFEDTTGSLASFKVDLHTLSGTMEWVLHGYLNGASFETPVEGTHSAELTVKLSGKPTLTATS